MTFNRKDFASGAIFIAVGLFYLIYALNTLTMGKALNMGPGYFPIVLSSIMITIGVIVVIRSFIVFETTSFGVVPWRAIVMLTLSIIVFAMFLAQLGLFPTVFVASLLACLSSSQIRIKTALIISICIAIFCFLVFKAMVALPIPMFGSWFEGTPLAWVEQPILSAIYFVFKLPMALFRFLGLAGR